MKIIKSVAILLFAALIGIYGTVAQQVFYTIVCSVLILFGSDEDDYEDAKLVAEKKLIELHLEYHKIHSFDKECSYCHKKKVIRDGK